MLRELNNFKKSKALALTDGESLQTEDEGYILKGFETDA